jgi:hypothetical protein
VGDVSYASERFVQEHVKPIVAYETEAGSVLGEEHSATCAREVWSPENGGTVGEILSGASLLSCTRPNPTRELASAERSQNSSPCCPPRVDSP